MTFMEAGKGLKMDEIPILVKLLWIKQGRSLLTYLSVEFFTLGKNMEFFLFLVNL